MLWWSLACASHGLTTSFGLMAASRFLLGMGEGGGFPAATKAVAEWFPLRERAMAMGIINGGTAVGAVVAPLIALEGSCSTYGAGLLQLSRGSGELPGAPDVSAGVARARGWRRFGVAASGIVFHGSVSAHH